MPSFRVSSSMSWFTAATSPWANSSAIVASASGSPAARIPSRKASVQRSRFISSILSVSSPLGYGLVLSRRVLEIDRLRQRVGVIVHRHAEQDARSWSSPLAIPRWGVPGRSLSNENGRQTSCVTSTASHPSASRMSSTLPSSALWSSRARESGCRIELGGGSRSEDARQGDEQGAGGRAVVAVEGAARPGCRRG